MWYFLSHTRAPPTMPPDQVGQAMDTIPSDYCTLKCWSCREKGHSTFTCPSRASDQRLFIAYRKYLNQFSQHTMFKKVYIQNHDALRGKATYPGPLPSTFKGGREGRWGYRGEGPTRVLHREDSSVTLVAPETQVVYIDSDSSHHSSLDELVGVHCIY